jgi:hypothetical protein
VFAPAQSHPKEATMTKLSLRARVASSRAARLAALPGRTGSVLRHDSRVVAQSVSWLLRSREHTNYTYDLTPLNLEHLAWWVSHVASVKVAEARSLIEEIRGDQELQEHVRRLTLASPRAGLADPLPLLGRRVGWYAVVRALRPSMVVETGTDKGLGSVVLAAALLRNGHGRLVSLDVNPASGYLVRDRYAEVTDLKVQDSLQGISALQGKIDLFIHDSLHSAEHEAAEFAAATPLLSNHARVLSDNAHVTAELSRWAEARDWTFVFFREEPRDHWYAGAGIGGAWRAG